MQQPSEEEKQLLLRNPIDFLSRLFDNNLLRVGDPTKAFEQLTNLKELIEIALVDPSFEKNVETITNINDNVEAKGVLGRFRGLVQDIRDVEFYTSLVEGNISPTEKRQAFISKYRDEFFPLAPQSEADADMDSLLIEERLPITLVPLPGPVDSSLQNKVGVVSRKRTIGELLSCDENSLSSEGGRVEQTSIPINYIAKMYDGYDQVRLNDVLEVVGIYTIHQDEDIGGSIALEVDPFDDDEAMVTIPPCLHCISFRKLGSSFPLLIHPKLSRSFLLASLVNGRYSAWSYCSSPVALPSASENCAGALVEYRTSVIDHIASCFGGDALLAEYVLLAVISRIYGRADSVPVGALGLRICCGGAQTGSQYTEALSRTLSELGLYTQTISADSDGLNKAPLMPQRCPKTGYLSQSPLQLPSGSVLIVDETNFDEGRLNMSGKQAMQTLRSVACEQLLPVMFSEYHQTKFPVDYPVISLCGTADREGAIGSGATCSITIKNIHIPTDQRNATRNMAGKGIGKDIPLWLASIRSLEVGIGDEVVRIAGDDFVRSRQADPRLTHGDFNSWITLARIVAASYGRAETCSEDWSRMRRLEGMRREREGGFSFIKDF